MLQPSTRDLLLLDAESHAIPNGQAGTVCVPPGNSEFDYQPPPGPRPLPPVLSCINEWLFQIFLTTVFAGTFALLCVTYNEYADRDEWIDLAKYASIPIVSIAFTWWHVWLGIQMCFYPVEFRGCCYPYLGWQGVVTRRAGIMAERACDIMIGGGGFDSNTRREHPPLLTVEEIVERIDPDDLLNHLEPTLASVLSVVVKNLADKHCPEVWALLPTWCQKEMEVAALDELKLMFVPVLDDVRRGIAEIVDIKRMAVDTLVANRPLLVEIFLNIGKQEFIFVQHVSAVMGFVCGIVQMVLWSAVRQQGWVSYVILPISGLAVGYLTNYLSIKMIFEPAVPKIMCGGYVHIQGVFLKRQREVSKEIAKTVCKKLVHARTILQYIVKSDSSLQKVIRIYEAHLNSAIDRVLGRTGQAAVGQQILAKIKADVAHETMLAVPMMSGEAEEYMNRKIDLENMLGDRLAKLHPRIFERMLHPVFQEDEWIILLLGGVLGVMVGTLQVWILGS